MKAMRAMPTVSTKRTAVSVCVLLLFAVDPECSNRPLKLRRFYMNNVSSTAYASRMLGPKFW